LLRSTYSDWELLVIGDGCTDDTETVVASFGDPRIYFYNLPQNAGEQSVPNNEGLRRARGRYIAFLNHDDLWFPDHLQGLVQAIEKHNADFVYAIEIGISPMGKPFLNGATSNERYAPQVGVLASQWLFRHELVTEIGYWRAAREIYNVPSQDWLFRVWRAKKQIIPVPQVTVLAITSGDRNQVYLRRDYLENEHYYNEIVNNPALREQLLTQVAIQASARRTSLGIYPRLQEILWSLIYRIGLRFNQSPAAVHYFFRFRRKGGFIDRLRKNRGLSALK
jgi:glycosyltransferase involved in cell wall biosynthesis